MKKDDHDEIIGEQFGEKETAVLVIMFFISCALLFGTVWLIGLLF